MSVTLEGTRILLRKPTMRDTHTLYQLASDRSISIYTNVPYPYTEDSAHFFVKKTQSQWKKNTAAAFVIVLKETKEVIGTISYVSIDSIRNTAEIGYWLGVPYRGNGYMKEALSLLLSYGFSVRKIRRIEAKVFSPNITSSMLLEAFGFVHEGTIRKKEKRNNEYVDEHIYSIFKEEYNR